ncbi:hypothetical protein LTR47_002646, partial [Exophiala xenobiotica]
LFGYDSGCIQTLLAQPKFVIYFHDLQGALLGAVISSYAGGAAVGCIIAGWGADWLGRRRTIHVGSLVALIGTAIQTGSVTVGMFICGRIIAGIAIGMLYSAIPTYMSELAPPSTRGWIVGFHAISLSIGYFVSSAVGAGTYWIKHSDAQWRVPLALQMPPAVILIVGLFWLPFSPRWLLEQGRDAEAYDTVKKLHYDGVDEHFFRAEFHQMKEQIAYEKANCITDWKTFVTVPHIRKRLVVALFIQCGVQLTGVNCINYYQTAIYKSLGQSSYNQILITLGYGIWGAWSTGVCAFYIDRWGRVKTIMASSAGLTVVFTCITILFAKGVNPPYDNPGAKKAVVAFIFIFCGVYATGFNGTWPAYSTEVFSQAMRARGTSIGAFASFVVQLVLIQITPVAFQNIGYRFYILFAVFNAAMCVIAWLWMPETKGLTLEEINALFGEVVVVSMQDELSLSDPASNENAEKTGGEMETGVSGEADKGQLTLHENIVSR